MRSRDSAASARQVVDDFECGEAPGAEFDHAAHIYVAWCYLRVYRGDEALFRLSGALRRFAVAAGAANKFHLTVTWAWMALISERMAEAPAASFAEFRARHGELFEAPHELMGRYYAAETLASERARCNFVLPDVPRL